MNKFGNIIYGVLLAVSLGFACISQAAEPAAPKLTLISNVNIFDGVSNKLALTRIIMRPTSSPARWHLEMV